MLYENPYLLVTTSWTKSEEVFTDMIKLLPCAGTTAVSLGDSHFVKLTCTVCHLGNSSQLKGGKWAFRGMDIGGAWIVKQES